MLISKSLKQNLYIGCAVREESAVSSAQNDVIDGDEH